jgi:hypothetical protein
VTSAWRVRSTGKKGRKEDKSSALVGSGYDPMLVERRCRSQVGGFPRGGVGVVEVDEHGTETVVSLFACNVRGEAILMLPEELPLTVASNLRHLKCERAITTGTFEPIARRTIDGVLVKERLDAFKQLVQRVVQQCVLSKSSLTDRESGAGALNTASVGAANLALRKEARTPGSGGEGVAGGVREKVSAF